jgi:MFS family permease
VPHGQAAIAGPTGRAYLGAVGKPLEGAGMASAAIAMPRRSAGGEIKAIALVSAAHFVSHFHMLVVPPLFALLGARWGVGFVALGLALTVSAVVSVLVQLPMGWLADRFGSRKLLVAGLCLGGAALASVGIVDRYSWLLVAAGLLGIANAVYHPADYAILSARVKASRIGRAFSVHTGAGMLGNAAAPVAMLILAPHLGPRGALIAAGLVGPLVAVPLALAPAVEGESRPQWHPAGHRGRAAAGRRGTLFTPALLGLVLFFVLLSLSSSGITNFSIPALMRCFHQPFAAANLALSAYLTATALGVLGGGFVADLTRRHGAVAAAGFGLNALIILVIATIGLGPAPLVALMGLAGLLSGVIQPSRDMLVRAAAPAGAIGRAFGMVTIGFSIGGMIGPMLFGWIMDCGAPRWIFAVSALFMVLTVAAALFSDRRVPARPAAAVP